MDNYKYNCLFCKYTTNSSQSWYQHTKAKKHLKNVKIAEQYNSLEKDFGSNIWNTCIMQEIALGIPQKKLQNETVEKNKQEVENQKFMMQYQKYLDRNPEVKAVIDKVEEEQRKRVEEQRKRDEQLAEEQRKRDEQQSKLMEKILLSQNNKEGISLNIEDMYEKIEKMIDKKLQGGESKTDNSENHHNHNSGTIFEAKHQNNLLNNLNLNYTNVISMEKFLYNMEHVNKIPVSDLEAIAYASENMKEDDLAETLHKTIMKNCE